jgi:hypothetical protein
VTLFNFGSAVQLLLQQSGAVDERIGDAEERADVT